MLKKSQKKKVQRPKPTKQNLIEDGKTWDNDINARLRSSKNRAWFIALVMSGVAGLSLLSLLAALPLKQVELRVISVDKSTGYTEIVKTVDKGNLSEDEAITQSNIVKYVVSRETYDPQDVEENFYEVTAMSTDGALLDYQAIWTNSSTTETPSEQYGFDTTKSVQIKNISFLAPKTVQVRFLINVNSPAGLEVEHKVAVMSFDYVQRPTKLEQIFQNPLGFKVSKYRVDQELLEGTRP